MRKLAAILLVALILTGLIGCPPGVKADAGSKRDYIIVLGTDALKTSAGLKAFVDYKSTSFDVSTISMPDIAKQFPGLSDSVEALRQYLDTKIQAVPPYVLLVGTLQEIPMSRFFTYIDRPRYDALTDACLLYDQSLSFFDDNKNGKPGELVEYASSGLSQKFVIGRLPTDSVAVLDSYFPLLVEAERRYESNPSLTGMVACAVENFVQFQYNSDQEGEKVKAALPSAQWTALYEKEGSYVSQLPAVPLTAASFVSNWNKGLDIVCTSAHGGNWRRIFDDKDNDGVYDDGEEHWVRFWGPLSDFQSAAFLGYVNGCDTFIDDVWTDSSIPYVDNLLNGELLNFVGYASEAVVSRDIPSLSDFFAGIANGYSIGDSLLLAKAKTPRNDVIFPWWSVVIAGDPSARLNSKTSAVTSLPSEGLMLTPLTEPITLSWNTTGPTSCYEVQVSRSSTFANIDRTDVVDAVSDAIPSLTAGDYFWRVRGLCDTGAGAWSETHTFSVAEPIALSVDGVPFQVTTRSITVSGTTNGDKVRVNGQNAAVKDGRFSASISLTEGDNTIDVIAFKGAQTTDWGCTVAYQKSTTLRLVISTPTIWVDEVPSSLEAAPVIKNGRTLVPIRAIIEALGGTVDWNGGARKAIVTLGSTSLELWIGKNSATVNSTAAPIDSTNAKVIPEIINGRTMLPLRFVMEAIGANVSYDQATQTITITYTKS